METEAIVAWALLVFGTVVPVAHVLLSRRAGPWTAPPGTRCPFGPRLGWLMVVLSLPFVGWVLFLARARKRHARTSAASSTSPR